MRDRFGYVLKMNVLIKLGCRYGCIGQFALFPKRRASEQDDAEDKESKTTFPTHFARVAAPPPLRNQRHHLCCQLWADARFFVFEKDERIFPSRILFADKLGPALDVALGVIFPTQP